MTGIKANYVYISFYIYSMCFKKQAFLVNFSIFFIAKVGAISIGLNAGHLRYLLTF